MLLAIGDGVASTGFARVMHAKLAIFAEHYEVHQFGLNYHVEVFIANARRIIDELGEAERAASGEHREPRGELIVTAPILFGRRHITPIVHDFVAAYPQVSVRLVLSDSVIDMVEAHVDVAVLIDRLPDSDLIARTAGHIR